MPLKENSESSDSKISKGTTANSKKESENYLKNAEMSVEDDYNSIDGIINNGSKQQEQEKFSKFPTAENRDISDPDSNPEKKSKSYSPLSRSQIKKNAKEIAKTEHNNDVNKSIEKGQAL